MVAVSHQSSVFFTQKTRQEAMLITRWKASQKYLPHIAAGCASLIVGSTVIVTSLLMQHVPPLQATIARFFIAFLCVVPFLWNYRNKIIKISRVDWLPICLLGLIFYFTFPLTFNHAMQRTTAAHGAVIVSTLPTLSLIFSVLLKVEKLNKFKVSGCCTAILGIFLAVFDDLQEANYSSNIILGDFLMFTAMVQGALFAVFSKKYFQIYGAWVVTVLCITIAFIVTTPFTLSYVGLAWLYSLSKTQMFYLLFLGSIGVPIQFGLFSWSVSKLGPSQSAMYVVLAPLSGSFFAVFILGEVLTTMFIIGLAFVSLAIFLMNYKIR